MCINMHVIIDHLWDGLMLFLIIGCTVSLSLVSLLGQSPITLLMTHFSIWDIYAFVYVLKTEVSSEKIEGQKHPYPSPLCFRFWTLKNRLMASNSTSPSVGSNSISFSIHASNCQGCYSNIDDNCCLSSVYSFFEFQLSFKFSIIFYIDPPSFAQT